MKNMDTMERILVVLIMVVELVIIFRAIMINTMMGFGFALFFHGLDYVIMQIHQKHFRDDEKRRK